MLIPAINEKRDAKAFFVYLTCIYILTWYLQLGNRIGLLSAIRFEFLLGFFLSICALLEVSREQESSPMRGPVIFFLVIAGLYTLISVDMAYSWQIYYNRLIKFSMLALFLAAFVRTPWALKMVVGAFLLAMFKLGLEGFLGWWTGSLVWQNQGIMRLHGSVEIYGHPNSFSGMAVGCLPFIYYLYQVVAKRWKLALLILLFFCTIIIVYTGSRTGYVATLGLGLLFFFKSEGRERKRYVLLALIITIGAALYMPKDYVGRFDSIFTGKEKEGASSETRMQIIRDAFAVYIHNPLGIGVGAFPLVRAKMFGRSQDTHNLYLELLTNMGILGVVAFFILVRRILSTNAEIQRRLSANDGEEGKYVLAISKAVVAFIYARLFLGLFGMDTYEIYWWFATGMTIAMWSISHKYFNNSSFQDGETPIAR